MELLVKQLAIPLGNQKTVAEWLVIAIRLGCIATAAKSLVMLRCGKNFLLTYKPYAARQNKVSV
jgi:hypothetical protein